MSDWTFCPHCGTRLDPTDTTCRGCGAVFGTVPDTAEADEAARLDAELQAIADELREALAPQLQLLKPLGQGGMGTVFLARDPALKRMVVVKVLSPELAGDYAARKRFEREAEAAASVAHPNVVSIHQVGQLPRSDTSYFVMQHVQGQTLGEAFPEGSVVPEHRANRIVGEVALALAAAHARGLVHRDIKPSNIMLEADTDRAIVLDFGISAAVRSDAKAQDTKLTAKGASIGTPEYMSPEQAAGEEVTERSDVYSLGLVAFQLVTGRPAFTADNAMALIAAHLKDTPPSVRELRPDLDPHVADLISRCLAKDPNDRPTAADLGRALAPGAMSIVEWPPPGLELIHGRAYRYLVGVTTFAILEAAYAAVSAIAMQEGSPAAAAAIGLLGGFLMLIYAVTIARQARHLPRGVRDAGRVGYPRGVVWDVAVDRRPDTAQLVNRVGPFASLAGTEGSRFLQRRRLGVLLAGALLVVALLSPVLIVVGLGGIYFWFQITPIPLAWIALWWCERPERRYRKRFIRQETAKGRITVSRDVTVAWLQAAGAPPSVGGRLRSMMDRVLTGAFNVAVTLVVVLGFLWFANTIVVLAEFESDPPGNPRTHVGTLEDKRDAARTPFPVLALDRMAVAPPAGDPAAWSALLDDSLHEQARDLWISTAARMGDSSAMIGPRFTGIPAALAGTATETLGPIAEYGPLEAWRSLGDSALPFLWYREAVAHRGEPGEGTVDTSAAELMFVHPLRHLDLLGTLELHGGAVALVGGRTDETLSVAAGVVRVARTLLRDPLTADAGLKTVERAIPLLRAVGSRPAYAWLQTDVASLETFVEDFGEALRTYAGRRAVKAMAETSEDSDRRDALLALASDTTLLTVHRLALARASVLGACYQGYETFFGSGDPRSALIDDVFDATAGLPGAAEYHALYRGLTWDRPVASVARWPWVFRKMFWTFPRLFYCQNTMETLPDQGQSEGGGRGQDREVNIEL